MLVSGHFPLAVSCKVRPTLRGRRNFMYPGQELPARASEPLNWKHQTALGLVLHSGGNSFNSKHGDSSWQTQRGLLSLKHPFSGFLQCSKCYANPFVSESYFSKCSTSSQGFCVLGLYAPMPCLSHTSIPSAGLRGSNGWHGLLSPLEGFRGPAGKPSGRVWRAAFHPAAPSHPFTGTYWHMITDTHCKELCHPFPHLSHSF